ncbi:hypothetical protein N7493_008513 [Penicillium malachiteum]|uniref:Uncharacterized protein n=1 Tax=Penicillium malachiteum TaxID=1324776 RepID=A0AAD6HH97_9EURO|nr:hypothetical protein N7493_008513 [Penicillium malachiteum]
MINGSIFTQGSGDARKDICEDCYRKNHYGKSRYKKRYKHCILPEAITPEVSREMCHCASVLPVDEDGQARSLFPVPMFDDHKNLSYARCKILNLDHDISLAKLHGLIIAATEEERLAKPSMVQSLLGKLMTDTSSSLNHKEKPLKPEKLPRTLPKHQVYPPSHPNGGKEFATEAGADDDVPLLFRRFAKQYPFGNVHMGLRIGPLVIENGVQQ